MSFYSDKTKASNLSGVDETLILDEMQESIDIWINTNIKWTGFLDTESRVEYYDIKKINQTELVLKHFPVVSISEIIDNAKSSDAEILNTLSYTVDNESGVVQLLNIVPTDEDGHYTIKYFTPGASSVKISYISGFASVPDIIVKLATLMLAKWAKIKGIQADGGDLEGIKSVRIGNYTETYDLTFLNIRSEFDTMLDPMIKRVQAYYADGF